MLGLSVISGTAMKLFAYVMGHLSSCRHLCGEPLGAEPHHQLR